MGEERLPKNVKWQCYTADYTDKAQHVESENEL